MGLLVPVGAVLIVIGTLGGVASCYGSSIFDDDQTETMVSRMEGHSDAPATATAGDSPRRYLAPLAGLALAAGLVCVGIGMGHWRRPIPSDVRPANPFSDQPSEHGEPPVGQV